MAGLVVVAAAFLWALPRFADYRLVWDQLTDLDRSVLPLLALVAAANLLAPSMPQRAALPGLGLRDAVAVDWITTTVTNLLPGGSALAVGMTWSMYRTCGLARDAIARSIVVTGLWDAFIKLGTPLIAIAWLATQRTVGYVLIQAAVIGALLFAVAAGLAAVILSGPATARRLGALLDRLPVIGQGWPDRLDQLRGDTVTLLSGRWRGLTFWTVAGHANLFLLLMLCGRAVGLGSEVLGWAAVLVAFAFGRLVTAVPITPGGLGVMEVSLVGAIGATTEAPDAPVVAAVLLFRFLSLVLPIPLGAISWVWWTGFRTRPTAEAQSP